jgi:hypothetical protein
MAENRTLATMPKNNVQPNFGKFASSSWNYITLAVAVLLSFVAFNSPWNSRSLPQTYALCSRGGKKVYTVDVENTQVECLLVSGSHIVGSGDLGMSSPGALHLVFGSW